MDAGIDVTNRKTITGLALLNCVAFIGSEDCEYTPSPQLVLVNEGSDNHFVALVDPATKKLID
jgi:hypothetical protein